jgi:hypothetical protein
MQYRFIVATLLLGLALAGCQSARVAPERESIHVSDDITLQPVIPGVWVHTTYVDDPNYGRIGANGLVIVSDKEAVLIDLPWTDEQTAALFDWVAENSGATVKVVGRPGRGAPSWGHILRPGQNHRVCPERSSARPEVPISAPRSDPLRHDDRPSDSPRRRSHHR